jgi:selenocysteine-specific elongation factor
VLRDPGRHAVAAGATVLDVDPPELRRRGAARQRAASLARLLDAPARDRLAEQVHRRGAVRRTELAVLGVPVHDPGAVTVIGDWLVDPQLWQDWQKSLAAAVDEQARLDPLDPRVPIEAARHRLQVPDRELVVAAARVAGLQIADGRLSRADAEAGAATDHLEQGLRHLERALQAMPYAAPERPELAEWGLGRRELAAAERLGRIVRLAEDVIVLPTGPATAMQSLAALPQPFTTSQARQALGITRRVAIPLLEYLDRRGWTVRVDADHRRVRTGGRPERA